MKLKLLAFDYTSMIGRNNMCSKKKKDVPPVCFVVYDSEFVFHSAIECNQPQRLPHEIQRQHTICGDYI